MLITTKKINKSKEKCCISMYRIWDKIFSQVDVQPQKLILFFLLYNPDF